MEIIKEIADHIEEFKDFINVRTVDRIITELNEQYDKHTVKVMLRQGRSMDLTAFTFLIYKINMLVGVVKLDDGVIDRVLDDSILGLDLANFLPTMYSFSKEDPKPKVVYDSFLDEVQIPYDNKIPMRDKFAMLEERISQNKPLKKEKKIREPKPKKERVRKMKSGYVMVASTPVNQYSMYWEFIAHHPDHKVIARELGTAAKRVINAAETHGTCQGYRWKIAEQIV